MKAMVLCAGHGTRLGDLTKEIPKAMLPLHGHPLLAYIISHLKSHDFDQIAINLHFRPEVIRDYFSDGSKFNATLTYSYEPELLGTAGGVKKMESYFRAEDAFLIHYGDILTDQDFTAMLSFHRTHNALATLLVHQRAKSNSAVSMDEQGRILSFLERPSEEDRQAVKSSWASSSICICDPGILDFIPAKITCDLPRFVFPRLVESRRLYGFPLSGYRCAIDSPERLAEAKSALVQGQCRMAIFPEDQSH
jgi:NDP-sugar pyrophosphorylase family protein